MKVIVVDSIQGAMGAVGMQCPKCGGRLTEDESAYYCPKDRSLFDKHTGQEVHVKVHHLEDESEYDEVKRRFRANMKGLYGKSDKDVDEILQRYETFFAEKKYSPSMRAAALELRQESETMTSRLGPSLGVAFVVGQFFSSMQKRPVPLRGPLTREQERLTEERLAEK